MKLGALLNFLTGRKSHEGPHSSPQQDSPMTCPAEADILAYTEGNLSSRQRENLERHFAACDDCVEFLGLYVRTFRDLGHVAPIAGSLDEAFIKNQSSKVLTMIKEDEFRRNLSSKSSEGTPKQAFLSFRQLVAVGTVSSTLLAVAIFWFITKDSNSELGMRALARATATERRTPVRVSGNFAHAVHNDTRGASDDSSRSEIDYAVDILTPGENPSASTEERLALARALLIRGGRGDVARAQAILEGLVATGKHSAEVLAEIHNDLGVVAFELRNYSKALDWFDQALSNNPNYDEALFNRALTKERSRDYEGARQDWESFINSTSDEAWKAEARDRLKKLFSSR